MRIVCIVMVLVFTLVSLLSSPVYAIDSFTSLRIPVISSESNQEGEGHLTRLRAIASHFGKYRAVDFTEEYIRELIADSEPIEFDAESIKDNEDKFREWIIYDRALEMLRAKLGRDIWMAFYNREIRKIGADRIGSIAITVRDTSTGKLITLVEDILLGKKGDIIPLYIALADEFIHGEEDHFTYREQIFSTFSQVVAYLKLSNHERDSLEKWVGSIGDNQNLTTIDEFVVKFACDVRKEMLHHRGNYLSTNTFRDKLISFVDRTYPELAVLKEREDVLPLDITGEFGKRFSDGFWADIILSNVKEEIRSVRYDYTGDWSEYQYLFDRIEEQVSTVQQLLELIIDLGAGHPALKIILPEILAIKSDLVNEKLLADISKTLFQRPSIYSHYLPTIEQLSLYSDGILVLFADANPYLVNQETFNNVVTATSQFVSAELGLGWTEDMPYPVGVFEALSTVPTHYAELLVNSEIDYRLLYWLLKGEHERHLEQRESDERFFGAFGNIQEEPAKEEGKGREIMKRQEGAIVRKSSGMGIIDSLLAKSGLLSPWAKELLLDYEVPEQGEYLNVATLIEMGKYLKTERRERALAILKDVARVDINLILKAGNSFGDDIYELLNISRESGSIDFTKIQENKDKYGLTNLFSAWAIGNREIDSKTAEEIRDIETRLARESASTLSSVVKAVIDEKSSWVYDDIVYLWNQKLFTESRDTHDLIIGKILSFQNKSKERFLYVIHNSGRVTELFWRPQTELRLLHIMRRIDDIVAVERDELEYRFSVLNNFVGIVGDDQFAGLLAVRDRKEFEDLWRAVVSNSHFTISISPLLRDEILSYKETYAEVDGQLHRIDEVEQIVLYIARKLGMDISDFSREEAKRKYRIMSKKYHPDKNPDDPLAEGKFKLISEGYRLVRKVIDEVESGLIDEELYTKAMKSKRILPGDLKIPRAKDSGV